MFTALQANRAASASLTGMRFFRRDALLDQPIGIRVECLRIIQQPPAFQRAKAGVQVIESRIDQPQRNNLDVQRPRQERM